MPLKWYNKFCIKEIVFWHPDLFILIAQDIGWFSRFFSDSVPFLPLHSRWLRECVQRKTKYTPTRNKDILQKLSSSLPSTHDQDKSKN
jgi:hypothetical protein